MSSPVAADPKIIDLMKEHKGDDPWVALEFFPPRTAQGVENLKARLPRMKREAKPMYVDITWGAGGTTADATMDITLTAKKEFGLIPNMHLTCTNIEAEKVKEALETCKANGITNIVALRGDAPEGQEKWEATEGGFGCGMDLVRFIRATYGDHFGISVAGYPEGHPDKIKPVTGGYESLSEAEKGRCSVQVAEDGTETLSVCSDADFAVEMSYLKDKVDAGADFIITQMFFDVQVYKSFCEACVACGINVPVVPGIMCLNAYPGFKKMGIMCKTRVPPALTAKMESLKDDKDAIKAYGSEFGAEMSRELMAVGAPGLHYYCLNLEIVVMGLLDRLNLRTVLQPPAPKGPASDYRVADITLADFGRKEIELAEHEMPGLMATRAEYKSIQPMANCRVAGSLHMTIQTAVLIETLQYLGADVRWCSCNIFSTQDHAAAAVVAKGTAAVFAWKGETLEEYWECTMNALFWSADDGKGRGPDMIVDDGGDMTLLVHEGVKAEANFKKDGSMPDPASTDNEEMKIVLGLLVGTLKKDPNMWHSVAARIQGVSEETTTGVHRLYQMQEAGTLLFACINVNDSVTKSKFDNLYGCKHSLPDGLCRATDVMLAGKKVLICGYGDVGKGCAFAMKAAGCITYVTEIDPICALQASMEGFPIVKFETVAAEVDIVITTTGNKDIIRVEHMAAMKNNCIVGNIGHFDNEIQMDALEAATKRTNIKPQVDKFVFPDGHGVIVLAEGRLMNLGCATGHPSFVMSCSFTNQTVAQIELWTERNSGKYKKGTVSVLPKILDEKVAELHLGHLGVEMTQLTDDQSSYISVPKKGPFKPDSYRY